MNETLIPLVDPNEVSYCMALTRPILESPGHLSETWLMKRGWVAVPAESALHFDDGQASLLATAMQMAGCSVCFAVAAEPLQNFPCCFRVKASQKGLLAFSRECSHFNFVLIPGDLSFVVLCTVFDYFVV